MSLVSHLYADPVGDSDADIRLPKGGELGQVLGLDTGGFAQGWECVFSRCPSAINGVWEVGAGQCGLSEPPKAVHPPASQGRRTQAGPSLWASTQSAPHAPWPCVVTMHGRTATQPRVPGHMAAWPDPIRPTVTCFGLISSQTSAHRTHSESNFAPARLILTHLDPCGVILTHFEPTLDPGGLNWPIQGQCGADFDRP